MILVITGMEVHPFDRLVRAIDELAAKETFDESFFIQLGSCTYEPEYADFERYLSFGDLCTKIRAASAVITHAGAGSTLTCIQQGKFPIMVPRRAKDHEHIDDHQFPFTEQMRSIGHAAAVQNMSELETTIRSVQGRTAQVTALGSPTELTEWLEGFWNGLAPPAT
ncbi:MULTISPECIES: glycosyltransferase [unclassified Mycobacterium]|uniref:glycosyltransferase n=1 Tax=unclassified Mycobacterium TaxID=2642494 RepID=UPI0029C907C8|nr:MULTISPECIES: glycosyltransferase [unclassified Mycobacterium]